MSEGDVLVLLLLALCAGGLAGAAVAWVVLWARTRWPQVLLRGLGGRYEIPVDVRLRAGPVALRVDVEQPEAVNVPIVVTAAPTTRELASRVLAAWPEIGPRKLAAICQCSTSTAHAIITEWERQPAGESKGQGDGAGSGDLDVQVEQGADAGVPVRVNGRAAARLGGQGGA